MTAMDGLEFRVTRAAAVAGRDLDAIIALFRANYREANVAYLERALGKLRNCAIAEAGGEAVGFALGEYRVIDLPRLPATPVVMAGICCVAPSYRRQGLFGRLERLACAPEEGRLPSGRMMTVGRMAHPASFRLMIQNPSHVPKRRVTPTAWQQAVGSAIAEAYGSPGFDPRTFVVAGSGSPIGYPVMELEVTAEEWEVFAPVDRTKGEALLGMAWIPDAPAGWDDP